MKFSNAIRFGGLALVCACTHACVVDPTQPPASKPLQIVAIDVEGGSAVLYVTPEGKSLLIDTGWPAGRGGRRPAGGATATQPSSPAPEPSSADRIIDAARKAGLSKIDFVLITHYHVDHIGGLGELISKFPVNAFIDHGPNREMPPADANPASLSGRPVGLYADYERLIAGRPRHSLKTGDQLEIGSMLLTAINSDAQLSGTLPSAATQSNPHCATMPDKAANGGEENARSLGVALTYGSARVVSLGDTTWNIEKALVCPINRVGRADLLMVSHHGSNLSNSPALLHALAPRVALMNNGSQKGGDPEVFDALAATPGLQRLWQVHFSIKGAVARNPAAVYIANITDEPDQYAALYVAVFADGRLTVRNGRIGFSESYPASAVK